MSITGEFIVAFVANLEPRVVVKKSEPLVVFALLFFDFLSLFFVC